MITEPNSEGGAESTPIKTVKAMPSSPVYAIFDIVELEGKQFIAGTLTFLDQFGMDRTAKTFGEKGVLQLGGHVLDIFKGNVDIGEPDEETKAKLAANIQQEILAEKQKILDAYRQPAATSPTNSDSPKAEDKP